MTDNTKLLELAERCEQGAGPEERLFYEAFEVIHGGRASVGLAWSHFCTLIEAEAWLDAAMALVPEGWAKYVADDQLGCHACVWERDGRKTSGGCKTAATPSLALCAAALRAKAAELARMGEVE